MLAGHGDRTLKAGAGTEILTSTGAEVVDGLRGDAGLERTRRQWQTGKGIHGCTGHHDGVCIDGRRWHVHLNALHVDLIHADDCLGWVGLQTSNGADDVAGLQVGGGSCPAARSVDMVDLDQATDTW